MPRNFLQAAAWLLGFAAALWLSPFGASAEDLETELYRAVLAVRAEHQLGALRRSPELDAVARAHSEDMARRDYLAHEDPEGRNPLQRIQASGLTGYSLAAENIAETNRRDPVGEVIRGWLASPLHRQNLLAPPFNATGIGIATGARGQLIVTQLFVSYPRPVSATPQGSR